MFGDFIITLTGNCEAYIENYRGIVSYDENKISIQGNHVILNICGCDLAVDFYSQESMKIKGKIKKAGICMIFFEKEHEKCLKILHFIFGRLYFQVKGYQTERFF